MFGWYGMSPQKNFGGTLAYGPTHWAYRSGFGEPYRNAQVELLWTVFCEARRLVIPGTAKYETEVVKGLSPDQLT
jgi:hypothetical protein